MTLTDFELQEIADGLLIPSTEAKLAIMVELKKHSMNEWRALAIELRRLRGVPNPKCSVGFQLAAIALRRI